MPTERGAPQIEQGNEQDPPPSYQEAVRQPIQVTVQYFVALRSQIWGPPPGYETLDGNVRQQPADPPRRCCGDAFFGLSCCCIFLGLFVALPIALVVMGTQYDCYVNIPGTLMWTGILGILLAVSTIIQVLTEAFPCHLFTAFGISILICLIFGSVDTYGALNEYQSTDWRRSHYCEETVFLFSFWFLNVVWSLLGLGLIIFCGFVCCMKNDD